MSVDPKIEKICNHIGKFCTQVGFTTEAGDPLQLTPYQEEFAKKVIRREKSKHIFVACTRGGKTESTSIIAILLALLYDGEKILIVAPTFKQANKLFTRIRSHILGSRHFLAPLIDKNKPFTKEELHFVTGSSITCVSAHNPESILGHGCSTLIIDESGSVDDNTYKTRIARTLTGKLKHSPLLIMLGTPHTINFFYEAWQTPDFERTRVHWKDAVAAGRLNEEEVEYQRSIMTPDMFAVWYEAEFRPLDEDLLFDQERVAKASILEKLSKPHPDYEYYFGVDVARYGKDKTAIAIIGVHKKNGLKVPVELHTYYTRSKFSLTETSGFILAQMAIWNPKYVYVDAIGVGAGAFDILREKLGGAKLRPFDFQGKDRSEAYLYVRQMLNDSVPGTDTPRLLLVKDTDLREQFKSHTIKFTSERKMRIEKKEGAADDIVDAIVMAMHPVQLRSYGDVEFGGEIFGGFFNNAGFGAGIF